MAISGGRAVLMKPVTSTISTVIALAALGLGSCQAQEPPRGAQDSLGYEDLRGSPPIVFRGRLWVSEGGIGGVLDPVERDGMIVVETAFSTSMFGLTWHDEPVAVVTNTLEVDCENQKYRKLRETWLSVEGEPLTRLEAANSPWLDGRQAAARWACGDSTIQPEGPRFSTTSEFVALYDAEAERLQLKPEVSGPTIVKRVH